MNLPLPAAFDTGVDPSAPLQTLYHAHATILAELGALAQLPRLMGRFGQSSRVRQIAQAALTLFQHDVVEHHTDEEGELFPAVIRTARPGDERERVQLLARTLVGEHRSLERTWAWLEPSLRAAAKGRAFDLDLGTLDRLLRGYAEHARFEEAEFLPLAQRILARRPDDLGALGAALHLRRVPAIPGYI